MKELEASPPARDPSQLTLIVANYVFPKSWEKLPDEPGSDVRVVYTVGVHPRFAGQVNDFEVVIRCMNSFLSLFRCVGVGELGLDETADCSLSVQLTVFSRLAPLAAKHKKTLVLHCRGPSTAERVLSVLKELGLTSIKIHFHCFTESFQVAEQWMAACSHICFGIGTQVLSNPVVADTATKLPIDNMVLESDAPYQPIVPGDMNTPWCISVVAERIAMMRNVPVNDLLHLCGANTRYIYSLWHLSPHM